MGSKWLARTGQSIVEWVGFVLVLYLIFWLFSQSSTPASVEYNKKRGERLHGREKRRKRKTVPKLTFSKVPIHSMLSKVSDGKTEIRKLSWQEIGRMAMQEDFINGYRRSIAEMLEIKYDEYLGRLQSLEMESQGAIPGDQMQRLFSSGKESKKKRCVAILDKIIERKDALTNDVVAGGLWRAFYDQEEGFPSVIGRDEMKDWLARHILLVCSDAVSASRRCLNMVFVGPSGTGKTRLAELVSFFYRQVGIFVFGDVIKASKKDFTSPYVDSGTHMTGDLLSRGLENILFFDEAYSLGSGGTNGHHSGHSQGAVDEIVSQSELNDGMSAIVMCGYAESMARGFFAMNEGLSRRFPHIFYLSHNNPDALARIFFRFLEAKHPRICSRLAGDEASKIYSLLLDASAKIPPVFPKQAGDMKTLASNFTESVYCMNGGSLSEIFALCLRDFSEPVGVV